MIELSKCIYKRGIYARIIRRITMFEVNGIAYASEKSNKISITDAKVTDHLMMIVTFSGGEKRVFDASVLTGSAFKPLKDDAIFQILKLCMASLHG